MDNPTSAAPIGRQFTVGRTFAVTARVIARNLGVFALITVVLGSFTTLACLAIILQFGWPEFAGNPNAMVSIALTAVVFALDWAFNGSVLAFLVLMSLQGRKASLRQCLTEGIRAFPRCLAILLPFVFVMQLMSPSVDTIAGFAFFLLSALCATFCWLIPPCIVWERADGGFWRNLNLLRGKFLRVYAIVAIFFIAQVILHRVSMFFAGPFLDTATAAGWFGAVVLMYAIIWLFGRITDVASAVSYFLIRVDLEGPPADNLAEVFD